MVKDVPIVRPTEPVQPVTVPDKLPEFATAKKALGKEKPKEDKKDDEKKIEKGLIKKKTASGGNDYWIYVPTDYDPNISYAIVVWLHPAGRNKPDDIDDFTDAWDKFCEDNHIILIGPAAP